MNMVRSVEISMFYGAHPIIFERTKLLRDSMTKAEKRLWLFLSKNKVMGLRLRAQHPIERFIADFYYHPIKLVIEVDEDIHNNLGNQEYDMGRTAELEKYEIEVLRFTNEQVLNHFDDVKKEILSECIRRKAEFKVPAAAGV